MTAAAPPVPCPDAEAPKSTTKRDVPAAGSIAMSTPFVRLTLWTSGLRWLKESCAITSRSTTARPGEGARLPDHVRTEARAITSWVHWRRGRQSDRGCWRPYGLL